VHVRGDHVIDLVRLHTECLQAFTDRMNDCACAFPGGNFVKAGVAYESAVRPFDHPDIIGN
jgi:hypothetical protein